jgi:hypothetical protein
VEDAVAAVGANGEGLGVVLEGVGWRLGALVDDGEFAALLEEIEGGVGAYAVDAAWGYVTGYAEMAGVSLIPHALQLADGDVVALVVTSSGKGQVGDGGHDDDRSYDEFDRAFLSCVCHVVRLSVYGSGLDLGSDRLWDTPLPPPCGYLARKLLRMIRLQVGSVCKIFYPKDLRAKYLFCCSYEINAPCAFRAALIWFLLLF